MSKYKFHNPDGLYFITFSVVNWVDVFSRQLYRDQLLEIFDFCSKNKGLVIHAYVIMSNHVHMIISRKNGGHLLANIMRDMKKFSSYKLTKAIQENIQESRKNWMINIFRENGNRNSNNTNFQFWQQDNHPIELDSNTDQFTRALNYIHYNPVKAGLVAEPADYLYSSARDYQGEKGLLEIEVLY